MMSAGSELLTEITETSSAWSIKARSTPWGPVSRAGGGNWRANWRRRDPELGCTVSQQRSRLSDMAGAPRPEGYTEAETSRTPVSARARNTQAPSAPGWGNREKGGGWVWMSNMAVHLFIVGSQRMSTASFTVFVFAPNWSNVLTAVDNKEIQVIPLLPGTVSGVWWLLSDQQWTARCLGMT